MTPIDENWRDELTLSERMSLALDEILAPYREHYKEIIDDGKQRKFPLWEGEPQPEIQRDLKRREDWYEADGHHKDCTKDHDWSIPCNDSKRHKL